MGVLLRWIFLLGLGYFIWLNLKVYFRKQERSQQRNQPEPDARRESITVVKCQQCQVHLPQHEAIAVDTLWFCCDEHRRQWLKRFGK